jgi:hypothetical protein
LLKLLINQSHFFINNSNIFLASRAVFPQNKSSGVNRLHTSGREGLSKTEHFKSSVKCIHRVPAGLPSGIPGIDELIEG